MDLQRHFQNRVTRTLYNSYTYQMSTTSSMSKHLTTGQGVQPSKSYNQRWTTKQIVSFIHSFFTPCALLCSRFLQKLDILRGCIGSWTRDYYVTTTQLLPLQYHSSFSRYSHDCYIVRHIWSWRPSVGNSVSSRDPDSAPFSSQRASTGDAE